VFEVLAGAGRGFAAILLPVEAVKVEGLSFAEAGLVREEDAGTLGGTR